ncbi:FUSC family protein [Pseudomonas sp. NA-150]|uniref:FUSC family protein n=1 Tax=Pseudomonas sp. NA-150 TaxID=3367525 RepID=UPI0037CA81E7
MNGFFTGLPPARDWFFGVRTFAASMIALYIALIMEMPRPYWAMATVFIVSSPFVGPTSSKALYRALGTFFGAAAAVFFVPLFVQTPFLLALVIALCTGTLLFLSLHLRTANSYAFMLAGYTLPLIAFPVVDSPLNVFDIASARTEEILLGIVCAAVVGGMFWPRRLAPVVMGVAEKWFADAGVYSALFLSRDRESSEIGKLRLAMVGSFNSLELMIGQLPHEGTRPQSVRNAKELRGRMIHLLPVIDALDDALWGLERRTPELRACIQPALDQAFAWLESTRLHAPEAHWSALRAHLEQIQPSPAQLDDKHHLLLSNALFRLSEWVDLWQDCRSLQHALSKGDQAPWRAVYRHWRLGELRPFFDHGVMMWSVMSGVTAIIAASVLWILLGWNDGGGAVILAAVACSFFAAMDDPAPQIYRFFFWTCFSVVLASLYLFVVLPNLNDFPMLVLAFSVPFICIGTLSINPRFALGMVLTLVNTSTFISIQTAYDTDFQAFVNGNLAGPIGLLFAFVWTLVMRPFGVDFASKRLTRFCWHDIVKLSDSASLMEHRRLGLLMLDRFMQNLPRLALTAQDTSIALRELRVALMLLDLLAYMRRVHHIPQGLLRQVIDEVGTHYQACLDARERLIPPKGLLMTMDRARRSLSFDWMGDNPTRLHLLNALSGLRLALLPGVEMLVAGEFEEQPPYGIDGAPS